jgi:hypothetical protein
MSRPLFYDKVHSVINMPVGASEVFKSLSGHYVKMDDSGRIEVAGAADLDIIGWAFSPADFTSSATEGADSLDVETNIFGIPFEIPACGAAGAAVTESTLAGMIGETCDIQMVSTYYQYADTSASTYDMLLCLGYRYYGSAAGMQSLIVRVNTDKAAYTTH